MMLNLVTLLLNILVRPFQKEAMFHVTENRAPSPILLSWVSLKILTTAFNQKRVCRGGSWLEDCLNRKFTLTTTGVEKHARFVSNPCIQTFSTDNHRQEILWPQWLRDGVWLNMLTC
uniref:Secreted protein n=1 Tax=Anguilla anguilla TaxID=7936 RepID=A0A0E9Q991_ANGAN